MMDKCTHEKLTLTSSNCVVLLVCRLVQVLLCSDSPPSDTLKMYCWSDPTPRTACYNPNPAACKYSYSWAVTPVVIAVQPVVGTPGDVLTLQGNAFDDVSAVLLTDRWGAISCPIDSKYSTNMTCNIPDMPAGQYVVRVQGASILCIRVEHMLRVWHPVLVAVGVLSLTGRLTCMIVDSLGLAGTFFIVPE
jgi:hypothetical protein